jgi:aminoglycoside phosphotransferase (APT) family kinase protein
VQRRLADDLAGEIIAIRSVTGGYSPCFAGAVDLADGRTVFIKAVSPAQNPDSQVLLRQEIDIVRSLPASLPAPRLLTAFEADTWVAAAFEHIDGSMPAVPWRQPDLDAALQALGAINSTPAPPGLRSARSALAPLTGGWERLKESGGCDDPWANEHIDELIDLERASLDMVDGDTLVHNDVRSDNILIDRAGNVTFVDWAHTCAGPPWLDQLLWLPALELEGGGTPEQVLDTAPITAPDEALRAVHAASTGYFLHRSTLPDPPGIPTVRAFQKAQGNTALRWLRQLLH